VRKSTQYVTCMARCDNVLMEECWYGIEWKIWMERELDEQYKIYVAE